MGRIYFSQEFATPITAARMFKALILDSHNLIPKLMPQSIKNIEFIEGDGGVGSIKQTNFTKGSRFRYLKHRIDGLNEANYACKYTLIESDILGDRLESITYEVMFEASGNGGSICRMSSEYHTKLDVEFKEEDIKEGKDKAMEMYNVVVAYLLDNPGVYA